LPQLAARLYPNVPLQFLYEHLMKKTNRPPQQIRICTAVEFSFAIEVTLSDSEISSCYAWQKGTRQMSPGFHILD
jgi:hypothetical protein